MKSKEISKLNIDELKSKINSLKKDLFNFRFRKINSQLEDTSKVSKLKKDLNKESKGNKNVTTNKNKI